MDPRTWRLRVRNNKNVFLVPSVFYLHNLDLIPLRRNIAPKCFIEKALRGVRLDDIGRESVACIRKTILDDTKRLSKDKSIHFSRLEVSTLLNTYYTLTGLEIRPLKRTELTNFLYLTFDITNVPSLLGLYRAGIKLSRRDNPKNWTNFDGVAFVRLMSMLLRGTIEERALLSFYILDEDDDGLVTPKGEMTNSLRGTFDPYVAASAPEIDPDEPSRDSVRYLMKKMGLSLDGGLNVDEFIHECELSPWLVDGIVPTVPPELHNFAFQTLISQVPKLPLIDNRAGRNQAVVNIKKRKKKDGLC